MDNQRLMQIIDQSCAAKVFSIRAKGPATLNKHETITSDQTASLDDFKALYGALHTLKVFLVV